MSGKTLTNRSTFQTTYKQFFTFVSKQELRRRQRVGRHGPTEDAARHANSGGANVQDATVLVHEASVSIRVDRLIGPPEQRTISRGSEEFFLLAAQSPLGCKK